MSDQPEQSFGSFEPSSVAGGGNAFIPIAIALVGTVVGIVAIIVALSRSGPSAELNSELERLRETNLELAARVADLEKFKAELADSNPGKQVTDLQRSVQTAFDQAGTAINQTNQRVSANAEKIAEVVKTLNEWATRGSAPGSGARAQASTATGGRGAAPSAVTGAGGTAATAREHTIESGDTFSRLAKRYNVSVSAILEANPDVDPRRLMLGQRIRIPAP